MIYINAFLAVFRGSKASWEFGETELNEIIFKSMSNGWISQEYVQDFYCKYITLKYVNIFEHIEIAESIYEVVVEHFYTKSIR